MATLLCLACLMFLLNVFILSLPMLSRTAVALAAMLDPDYALLLYLVLVLICDLACCSPCNLCSEPRGNYVLVFSSYIVVAVNIRKASETRHNIGRPITCT